MQKQLIRFKDLGSMEYAEAWDFQEDLLKKNLEVKTILREEKERNEFKSAGIISTVNHLLFVEHPPVYTLGKSGKDQHLLFDEEEREKRGIEFFRINRGGDITFHGPGQIVGYPILDLENYYTDIGRYLRSLEEVIILTLKDYGIEGGRSKGETGVWIDSGIAGRERKICAMGIRCSRWITMHGFAFNVNTDLSFFNGIVPCGIQHKQVTSLSKEIGLEMDMEQVKDRLKKNFELVFDSILVESELI